MSVEERIDQIFTIFTIAMGVLAAALVLVCVGLIAYEERRIRRDRKASIEREVLRAEREIHFLAEEAFDQMLRESRQTREPGSVIDVSMEPPDDWEAA